MKSSINFPKSTIIFWALIILFFALLYWAFTFKLQKSINIDGFIRPLGMPIIVQNRTEGKVSEIHTKKSAVIGIGEKILSLETEIDKTELYEKELNELTNLISIERLSAQLQQSNEFSLPKSINNQFLPSVGAEKIGVIFLEQIQALLSENQALKSELVVIESEKKVKEAEIRVFQDATKALKQELKIAIRKYELVKKLFKEGFEGEISLMEAENSILGAKKLIAENQTKLALAEDERSFINNKSDSLISNYKKEAIFEINKLKNEIRVLNIEQERIRNKLKQLVVRSPGAGIISVLNVDNVGQVLSSGDVVAEIIPAGMPLVFYANVPNRNITEIKTGMLAKILPATFDSRSDLPIEGKIIEIAPDVTEEEGKDPYYEIIIGFQKNTELSQKIRVGVTGTASVVFGDRTIIDYYFDPLINEFRGALSE